MRLRDVASAPQLGAIWGTILKSHGLKRHREIYLVVLRSITNATRLGRRTYAA